PLAARTATALTSDDRIQSLVSWRAFHASSGFMIAPCARLTDKSRELHLPSPQAGDDTPHASLSAVPSLDSASHGRQFRAPIHADSTLQRRSTTFPLRNPPR